MRISKQLKTVSTLGPESVLTIKRPMRFSMELMSRWQLEFSAVPFGRLEAGD